MFRVQGDLGAAQDDDPSRGFVARKVDIRLPGKGNPNSHAARPDHSMMVRSGFGPAGCQ